MGNVVGVAVAAVAALLCGCAAVCALAMYRSKQIGGMDEVVDSMRAMRAAAWCILALWFVYLAAYNAVYASGGVVMPLCMLAFAEVVADLSRFRQLVRAGLAPATLSEAFDRLTETWHDKR